MAKRLKQRKQPKTDMQPFPLIISLVGKTDKRFSVFSVEIIWYLLTPVMKTSHGVIATHYYTIVCHRQ